MFSKRIIAVFTFVLLAVAVHAQDFGVGLILDHYNYQYSLNDDSASNNETYIGIKGYYFMQSGMDISLGFYVFLNSKKDEASITDDVTDDYQRNDFFVNGGINKTLIEQGAISAGLGGRMSLGFANEPSGDSVGSLDEYSQIIYTIAVPASIDIRYNKHMTVRLQADLLSLQGYKYHRIYEATGNEYNTSVLNLEAGGSVGAEFILTF